MIENNFNSAQVYKTLKIVLKILKKYKVKHWFEGSIIPTALNGKPLRQVNDLDIVLVSENPKNIIQELKRHGYKRKTKNIYRVSDQLNIFTFEHPKLLEVGFFAAKEIGNDYVISNVIAQVIIPKHKLPDTKYRFKDLQFNGIPASAAYTLSRLHPENPKREKELKLFKKLKIKPGNWPLYDFYLLGFKAKWAIDFINFSLVIIGKIRLTLGKPYDPWR